MTDPRETVCKTSRADMRYAVNYHDQIDVALNSLF